LAPPSAKEERAQKLVALAKKLYLTLADGYAGALRYNLRRGCALYDVPSRAYDRTSYTSDWVAAKERLGDGTLRLRAANPYTLLQHLQGRYDVALQAPSWTRILVLDLDRPAVRLPAGADEYEKELAELAADRQRDETLERVWVAFRLDETPDRQPVVLMTPGGGYHLYFPLDRHWPVAQSRQILEHHLHHHRLGVKPGVLEIYPSGVPLRVPCGRGMALLRPARPLQADALELQLVHARWVYGTDGTMGAQTSLRRDVVPLLETFLVDLEVQRRPLEKWLDPDATTPLYAKPWGPWLLREKQSPGVEGQDYANQHIEDFKELGPQAPTGVHPVVGGSPSGSLRFPISNPPPVQGDLPSAEVAPGGLGGASALRGMPGGFLLRGAAWWAHVAHLLSHGIPTPKQRHDAALKVAWYYRVVEGRACEEALDQVAVWLDQGIARAASCGHASYTLRTKGAARFRKETLREVRHYLKKYLSDPPPRRPGVSKGVRSGRLSLAPGDAAVVERFEAPLRPAAQSLLSYLATYATEGGRVPGPVALSAQTLEALCGQGRVQDEARGLRRLANVVLERFEALGVLQRHRNHSAGRHAREYTVWYTFGTGRLPEREEGLGLALGRRAVEEGELVAYTSGEPGVRVQVELRTAGDVVDTPHAWWRKMYQRRVFTPAEFFDAEERHILAGPFRDRWPEGAKSTSDAPRTQPEMLPTPTLPLSPSLDLRASDAEGDVPMAAPAGEKLTAPALELGATFKALETKPSVPVEPAPLENEALFSKQRAAFTHAVHTEPIPNGIHLAQLDDGHTLRYPTTLTEIEAANEEHSRTNATVPTEPVGAPLSPLARDAANDEAASAMSHVEPRQGAEASYPAPPLVSTTITTTDPQQPTAAEVMLQLHRKRLALGYPCDCALFCARPPPR
jgi:hypothetical protein